MHPNDFMINLVPGMVLAYASDDNRVIMDFKSFDSSKKFGFGIVLGLDYSSKYSTDYPVFSSRDPSNYSVTTISHKILTVKLDVGPYDKLTSNPDTWTNFQTLPNTKHMSHSIELEYSIKDEFIKSNWFIGAVGKDMEECLYKLTCNKMYA